MTDTATLAPVRVKVAPVSRTQPLAFGGGLEGADRMSREMATWRPSMRSPDQVINTVKPVADARGREIVQNDGYAMGAVTTHRDSIVGHTYRLNAAPNLKVIAAHLGVTPKSLKKWSEEFQEIVEARFNLIAESPKSYLDAAGMNTLTGLVRLAVGGFVMTGEVLATAEWLRQSNRPLRTAIQMVSPDRLSNPDMRPDTRTLRRGIEKDTYGKPIAYHIRRSHPTELYDETSLFWSRVPAEKPWGRRQVVHIIEQLMPDQSRGVADMVSVLKQMKMTKQFQEVTLQNAVVNASYAAAIESELPPEVVFEQMGAGAKLDGMTNAIGAYLTALSGYLGGANNVAIDGVKIPHLFPGTKLNMKPMGTPGGVGSDFEESLQRNIAAALGLSYEEFSRDFSKTSYSSARASMVSTWRFMQSRKKIVADRFASSIYDLVLEEELNAGAIPLPPGMTMADYYNVPLLREALSDCTWIGASRGQIDELKETQAAILRIKSGLSTYEDEAAKLGKDWRDIFEQRAREEGLIKEKGLAFSMDAQREGKKEPQNTLSDDPASGTQNNDASEDE
jgi:lambda family phage portal protein